LVLGLGTGYRGVASLGPVVARAGWPLASDLSEYTRALHVHSNYVRTVPLPGPGVYRVEVDLRVDLFPIGGVAYRPWIFSNPVCIRG
jgi:hypothetical protein